MDNYDPVDRPTDRELRNAQSGACSGGCALFVLLLGGIAALAGGLPSDQGASTAVFIIALVISIGLPAYLYERWKVNKAEENYNWRMHRVREEEQERRHGSRRRRRR